MHFDSPDQSCAEPNWLHSDDVFPGNRAAFAKLRDALKTDSAIAFVGAGASAPIYPTWTPFLRSALKHLERLGAGPSNRLQALSQQLDKPLYVADELESLSPSEFYAHLAELFGSDRPRPLHTDTHEQLMRLPFSSYVTTNYDVGLEEARRVAHPELTSYNDMSAHQPEAEERWRGSHGHAFSSGAKEILHLHGRFNERNSIVITLSHYRLAYATYCSRILQSLWSRRGLIFVGYGFRDPWIDYVSQVSLSGLIGPARHFAFISVHRNEIIDRGYFEKTYGICPVFYPVNMEGDHSNLGVALSALSEMNVEIRTARSEKADVEARPVAVRIIHNLSNDKYYTGRAKELQRLTDIASAPEVRVVAVTGIGGLGKTSLVGHWISRGQGVRARAVEGVFVWSFYEDRSVEKFFRQFLDFASKELNYSHPTQRKERGDAPAEVLLDVLRSKSVLLVLDGLEVIQADRQSESYGMVLSIDLSELICGAVRDQLGLIVLTSRFSFTDLNRYRGLGYTEVQLPRLSEEDGAELLSTLGVRAATAFLEDIVRSLHGHGLGLRLFGAAVRRNRGDIPSRALWMAGADEDMPARLGRLFVYYAGQLSETEKRVASVVALFPRPVSVEVVGELLEKLHFGVGIERAAIERDLVRLERDGLLVREPGRMAFAAHPIVREFFRGKHADAAMLAAEAIAGSPNRGNELSIDSSRDALDGVAILCDAGLAEKAWELYWSRFGDGPTLGRDDLAFDFFEVERRFVSEEALSKLSAENSGSAFQRVATRALMVGEVRMAVELQTEALRRAELAGEAWDAALRADALTYFLLQDHQSSSVLQAAERALDLANQSGSVVLIVDATARVGMRLVDLGRCKEAAPYLAKAYEYLTQDEKLAGNTSLDVRDILGTALRDMGESYVASNIFDEDSALERRAGRYSHADVQKAEAAILRGQVDEYISLIQPLLTDAQRGRSLFKVMRHGIGLAKASIRKGCYDEALEYVLPALEIAGSRGFRRLHCEALIVCARAVEGLGRFTIARNYAEDALAIARSLEDAVIERDALEALVFISQELGDKDLEGRAAAEFNRLARLFQWPDSVAFPWPRSD